MVFFKDGKKIPISVGKRNDMYVQVLDGLKGNETVCMVDPTVQQQQGLPGDKATQPEINQGQGEPRPGGGGQGGGGGMRRPGGGRRGQ